jgi:hypothetical protein
MEERRVVVEQIAVLDQAGRPAPGHVQMLLLVRVEAIVQPRQDSQSERDRCSRPEQDAFACRQLF